MYTERIIKSLQLKGPGGPVPANAIYKIMIKQPELAKNDTIRVLLFGRLATCTDESDFLKIFGLLLPDINWGTESDYLAPVSNFFDEWWDPFNFNYTARSCFWLASRNSANFEKWWNRNEFNFSKENIEALIENCMPHFDLWWTNSAIPHDIDIHDKIVLKSSNDYLSTQVISLLNNKRKISIITMLKKYPERVNDWIKYYSDEDIAKCNYPAIRFMISAYKKELERMEVQHKIDNSKTSGEVITLMIRKVNQNEST